MNRRTLRCFAVVIAIGAAHGLCFDAQAQGSAFTYQGRLNGGGAPASGTYDFQFTLYATNVTGTPIAGPLTNSAVPVTNGLFTTVVDFGNVFAGASNWLEIAVSTNGADAFTTLAPRQQLTPVPYAIFASAASNVLGTVNAGNLSGTVPLAQLPAVVITNGASGVVVSGTFTGNGAGLTNLNAAQLTGTVPLGVENPAVVISATSFYFTNGNGIASYRITNAYFGWMNLVVYSNAYLSQAYGSFVYTNTATNGLPVFLAYNDPQLTAQAGFKSWDISTAFPDTNFVYTYFNGNSATDSQGNYTNLLGLVWQLYSGGDGSVQVLAQQQLPLYRLFMFSPALTNGVLAFDGTSPTNLPITAQVIFSDTNAGADDHIRDVCHLYYTNNSGQAIYLLSWSHYGVGQGFGLATAPDDTNYTFKAYIGVSLSGAFSNQTVWSPKLFVNATNGLEVTGLIGPTNVDAMPTNIFVAELDPVTFTNISGVRLLNVDANMNGAAALYSAGMHYYFSGSGVIWTNHALSTSGWTPCWTNGAAMIGGTVVDFNGLHYWYNTYLGLSYSTATNYAGPWSAPVVQACPLQDQAEGDGTFLLIPGGIIASTVNIGNSGVQNYDYTGSFLGDAAGLTNLPSTAITGGLNMIVTNMSSPGVTSRLYYSNGILVKISSP